VTVVPAFLAAVLEAKTRVGPIGGYASTIGRGEALYSRALWLFKKVPSQVCVMSTDQ
jgi:hypothetical protein